MKHIKMYRTESGQEPFRKWFMGLKDKRASSQIDTRIRRLALGQRGDCKQVSPGVFELRIH